MPNEVKISSQHVISKLGTIEKQNNQQNSKGKGKRQQQPILKSKQQAVQTIVNQPQNISPAKLATPIQNKISQPHTPLFLNHKSTPPKVDRIPI